MPFGKATMQSSGFDPTLIPTKPTKVILALPSYNGWRRNTTSVSQAVMSPFPVLTVEVITSLLGFCFNKCWAVALNNRPISHFAMLHADVVPKPSDWLLRLIREMDKYEAGVLSVSMPIKDAEGLTSTALDMDDQWRTQRITQQEMRDRPETWTDPRLLINTGLMIVDFSQPWVEEFAFTINDRIIKNSRGRWEAEVEPEDWNFSRFLHSRNVPVYVTRTIPAAHWGEVAWDNQEVWGHKTDPTLAESLRRTSQPPGLESNPLGEGKAG